MLEVKRALAMTSLLTLTGVGGCGKTRLAQEVARDLAPLYPDGVWFVELAPVSDPSLVPQAVAAALDVREQPGRALVDTLVDILRKKRSLLVLDNCEHLIDAAARLADTLLSSCTRLKILATSREPLNLAGEVSWAVPPLSVPGPAEETGAEERERSESVRLFVDRALHKPRVFAASERNVEAVANICRRLEGIPLAIELAAARVGTLGVEQISERLGHSLQLLGDGSRTAESRQQTLYKTLDWSYELLDEKERILFRRLSAFAGGWTLEAAEAVCAGDGIEEEEILDLLSRLVDKSLANIDAKETARYRFLEPVRQYARDRLEESGEADEVRRRHAEFYLAFAERAERELSGPEQVYWMDRLETEYDNIREALGWVLNEGDGNKGELGLRLAAALWRVWYLRGHLNEGRLWIEEMLALDDGGLAATRARALGGAGYLAWHQGDFGRAEALFEESLALARQGGYKRDIAAALNGLGRVASYGRGDIVAARANFDEALSLYRESGDRWGVAMSLYFSGVAEAFGDDPAAAVPLLDEALAMFREVEDWEGIADSVGVMGMVSLGQGEYPKARRLLEESQEIMKSLGDKGAVAKTLSALGDVALGEGDPEAAYGLYEQALAILKDVDDKWWIAWCLEGMAGVAAAQRDLGRAARLFGAAAALRDVMGAPRPPLQRANYERRLASARAESDEASFEAAWEEGREMAPEEAVEHALEMGDVSITEPQPDLTPREREIAELVGKDLTNRQIAGRLDISRKTVDNHVSRILKKLGAKSREEVASRLR